MSRRVYDIVASASNPRAAARARVVRPVRLAAVRRDSPFHLGTAMPGIILLLLAAALVLAWGMFGSIAADVRAHKCFALDAAVQNATSGGVPQPSERSASTACENDAARASANVATRATPSPPVSERASSLSSTDGKGRHHTRKSTRADRRNAETGKTPRQKHRHRKTIE
jgi:hypothetical protein